MVAFLYFCRKKTPIITEHNVVVFCVGEEQNSEFQLHVGGPRKPPLASLWSGCLGMSCLWIFRSLAFYWYKTCSDWLYIVFGTKSAKSSYLLQVDCVFIAQRLSWDLAGVTRTGTDGSVTSGIGGLWTNLANSGKYWVYSANIHRCMGKNQN